MTEKLCTLETAILAKEKGFDWKTMAYFNSEGDLITPLEYEIEYYPHEPINHNSQDYNWSRPTQALLQKWLREVHNIHLRPDLPWIKNGWKIDGFCLLSGEEIFSINKYKKYKSYEEVLEIGLQEALKLISK